MDAIKVDSITKTYGARKVLDNISFNVKAGTIHGFLGPNGAGKTTTMRLIANLLRADDGSIWVNGEKNNSNDTTKQPDIGFLLEEPPLYKDMIVKVYLYFIAQVKGMSNEKFQKQLLYVAKVLQLESVLNRKIGNLSKGFKQRIGIAQALISNPSILILDEPTSGLDPQSVLEMRNLIKDLKKNHTVLISSHLLHEMSLVCDNVSIISNGKIIESGSIAELTKKIPKSSRIVLECLEPNADFVSKMQELSEVSFVAQDPEITSTFYIEVETDIELRDLIIEKAIEMNMRPIEIRKEVYGLEDIFMRVTESC